MGDVKTMKDLKIRLDSNKKMVLERWEDIPGYERLYQVSNLGRVKSLEKQYVNSLGRTITRKENLLSLKPTNRNRVKVVLFKDNNRKYIDVHILVALAFIGERPEGYDVCHKDGNPSNNNVNNLRYDTRSENIIDNYRYGSKHSSGKLSIDDVLEIRRLHKENNISCTELASIYNVGRTTVSKIVNRKSYTWLNDEGNILDSDTQVVR